MMKQVALVLSCVAVFASLAAGSRFFVKEDAAPVAPAVVEATAFTSGGSMGVIQPEPVFVPNFVGRTVAEAKILARNYGLSLWIVPSR